MPDLEMLLRDVRPAPNAAWAEKLDARVAARFPGPVPAYKRKLQAFREHLAALMLVTASAAAVLLVLVVVVKNVDSTGGDKEASTASSGSSASAPALATAEAGRSGEKSASGGSDSASSAAPQTPVPQSTTGGNSGAASGGRAVIASATLTLTTGSDDVESVTDRAIRLTDTLGGFVQTSSTNRSGSRATATLTLKLPSAQLDAGIAQLSKLAHVRSRSQEAQDVTDQRSALQAAVRDARADRDGLRTRLAKATTDKERSRLRALLDRASRRVTQRERDVAELGQRTSFSTVDLSIVGTRKAAAAPAPAGRWTPGDAAKDAGRVLEVIAGVLVIAFAILIPLGILAGLAAYANRGLTRRRRERALEAS
jgi:hypothetical protein